MKKPSVSGIVTHDGAFHADEIFAIAMIFKVHGFQPVVRTRDQTVLAAAKESRDQVVVDVGGEYAAARLNFDHHQDLGLPSSAGLVWLWLRDSLLDNAAAKVHFARFINALDVMDCHRAGVIDLVHALPPGFDTVSSVISGFNRVDGNQAVAFEKALQSCHHILDNKLEDAKAYAESLEVYERRVVLENGVIILSKYITLWKEIQGRAQFAILPNPQGWALVSSDARIAQVPEAVSELPGFVFRHASGFMAVCKDLEPLTVFAKAMKW